MTNKFVGFRTLLSKEVQRFIRVAGQTILSPLISASLYLLIFGVNLAEQIQQNGVINYLEFIIPGLVALGILNNAFQNSASSVIISKFHGDLQDLKTVPLTPSEIVWAYALGATLRGVLIGLAVLIVGEIFYFIQFERLLPIQNGLLLLLFSTLGGLTFGFLGLCVAIYANNFDQVSAISTFVILPLIYLGGVFFSLESTHPFWRTISYCNPLFYIINGIRYSFLGVSDISPVNAFLLSSTFVALSLLFALRSIRKGSYTRF